VTAGTDCTVSQHLRCGGKLFHSPGPAAAKALSPKVLWVRVTTHVRLSVERRRQHQTELEGDKSYVAYVRLGATRHKISHGQRSESGKTVRSSELGHIFLSRLVGLSKRCYLTQEICPAENDLRFASASVLPR